MQSDQMSVPSPSARAAVTGGQGTLSELAVPYGVACRVLGIGIGYRVLGQELLWRDACQVGQNVWNGPTRGYGGGVHGASKTGTVSWLVHATAPLSRPGEVGGREMAPTLALLFLKKSPAT